MPMIAPSSVIWLAPGARDPEVGHLHDALRVDDDVVRLDVAVDDAVSVRVAQRSEDLARVGDRDRDRAEAARADELLQRPSLDVLHDDEVRAVGLAAVEDRDDVRVREAGGVRRLAAEPLDELLVVRRSAPCSILIATLRPSSWSSAR